MVATVHPAKGYLNTSFYIHNTSESIISFSIKNENGEVMAGDVPVKCKKEFFATSPGVHRILFNDGTVSTFMVEDALRFGGSSYKRSFIFDKCPWCFVVMRDRTYVYNRLTQEAYMESVSPDDITAISEDYVIFANKQSTERTIYSLKEQRPEIVVENIEFYNSCLVVYADKKNCINAVRGYSLDKHCECFCIEATDYCVNADNKFLSYTHEGGLFIRNLETGFDDSVAVPVKGEFITFVGNQLAFVKYQKDIYHIWSLVDQKFLGTKTFKNLAGVEQRQLIDLDDRWKGIHCIDLTNSDCPEAIAYADYVELEVIPVHENVFFIEKRTRMESNCWSKSLGRTTELTSLNSHLTIALNGWWFGTPTTIGDKIVIEDNGTNSSERRYIILSQGSSPEISSTKPTEDINHSSTSNYPNRFGSPSESGRYSLGVEGQRVLLCDYTLQEVKRITILEDLFDATGYKNVYFSEDGKSVVHNEPDGQSLLDTETGETIQFESKSFIKSVNGFRPTFTREGARAVKLVNPATGLPINLTIVSSFKFVSPDGSLYSDGELKQYVKYYDEIKRTYLSPEQYRDLERKYSIFGVPNKDDIMALRKQFAVEHLAFFKGKYSDWASRTDEEWIKVLTYGDSFIEHFVTPMGFAMIRSTETKEVISEIPLGPALWYLNYVSFSYDLRYVAIAGRYPDHTHYEGRQVGGLFLIYDLNDGKEIYRMTDSDAVWTTSFTRDGHVGAYSSNPITFIAHAPQSERNSTLKGYSFLTFSPDGKYMALSRQGYVRYSDGKGGHHTCWGHQPSSEVFIFPIASRNESEYKAHFDDLSDQDIEGVNTTYPRVPASVASVSFSKDNRRLMMVGKDGVIIIRNLHLD